MTSLYKLRQMRQSLVARRIRGPSGCCWYKAIFRAKPGDKYTYRTKADHRITPEWGVWPLEPPDRLVKDGFLRCKGTPLGAMLYKKRKLVAQQLPAERVENGALLLDCDGTIAETERDGHRVAFNQAFKEKGFDCEWDVEEYGELLRVGGGKERMAKYFSDVNPEAWPYDDAAASDHPAIKELHELKTAIFMDIVKSGALPLRDGIEELVSEADAAGWQIAVCSTSNEAAVTAIVETLLPEFAARIRIFAGDVVQAKKPDPAIYLLAAEELGVPAMACVVVEDSNIGLRAAKSANMQVIVTTSIYTDQEDFDDADIVVASATEVDFIDDVLTMLPAFTPEFIDP